MGSGARGRYIVSVTVGYLLLALAWIFLSDQLLGQFVPGEQARWIGTAKGVFFVLSTALLFALALRAVPAHDPTEIDKLVSQRGRRRRWWAYGLAVVLSVLMLALHRALIHSLGDRPMLILFMLPITVSALLGGWLPGLSATLFTTLGVIALSVAEPNRSLGLAAQHDLVQWVFLLLNGVAVSLLSEQLGRALVRAEFSRGLLQAVVSGTSDAVFVKDVQGRYLYANEAAARFVGRPVKDIIGADDGAIFPNATAEFVRARDRAVLASGLTQTHEELVRTADGRQLNFLVTKGVIRDGDEAITGLFGISRDITARSEAEARVQRSEAAMLAAQRLAHVGNWSWQLETGAHFWSAELFAIFGLDPAQAPPELSELDRHFLPASWQLISQSLQQLRDHGGSFQHDAQLRRADSGELRWVTARGQALLDEQGRCVQLIGTLQDITERKRLDDDLHFVLQEAVDGIWIADEQGRYLYANPAACRLTGHSLEQLQAMHISEMLSADELQHLQPHLQQLELERFIRREWRLRRDDGSEVCVELTTTRMEDGRYMAFGRDLSERKRAEAALRENEHRLARVLEGSDQGYWDWDLIGQVFHVSPRFETMLGYDPGEMRVQQDNWPELVHPEDLAAAMRSIDAHLAGVNEQHDVEIRCRNKNGHWRWIHSRGRVVEWTEDGRPRTMSGTHTDITERKNYELAQREAATVFSSSYEGIMVVSTERLITKVNPAFERITGYSAAEVVGQSPRILASGQHSLAFYAEMWDSVRQHDFWRGEIWNRRKSGEIYAEMLSISVVRNEAGVLQHYIGVFTDISQQKTHEAELDRIAHFDALTGMPNRRLLSDRLNTGLLNARRNAKSLAVCYLDLDGFKSINDQHGHSIGDQLLVQIAERIAGVLRSHDTIARLGGDEFVLLLAELERSNQCQPLLERVLSAIQAPLQVGSLQLQITASIGVTLFPEDGADADTLLRHADQAMYMAKDAGKNRYYLFDPVHDRQVQVLREQQGRLRQALNQDEFVLYYQPKVDLADGRVIGMEALIRWQHPEQGLLPPGRFLHHVDGSELEVALGEWVLDSAMRQVLAWQQQGLDLHVSVNISALHLLQNSFVEELAAALQRHPALDPSRLELEILETAGLSDLSRAVQVLTQCQALGVSFALDDFGTGYSSLAYFRALPVQLIKIDQSFVRDMLSDASDFGIVDSVVRLARAFNRPVIAEGVETLAHGAALLQLGCRMAQGYGIARPMPAEQVPVWVAQWQDERVWTTLAEPPAGPGLPQVMSETVNRA
ncbi:PAS domain S-box protein [Paucibacter sp. APW11]|uniref:PAS domain S-box protein n=1 Tax=Roseateles aquae TaxID=3077235 RepID=A0ABU3PIC9_9BURK|nr:PAS domain S-box protein [Paucibacter sp. APW11]MDT9002297.1 PAS domain S-box protein [Paucibacter sp. APW11]